MNFKSHIHDIIEDWIFNKTDLHLYTPEQFSDETVLTINYDNNGVKASFGFNGNDLVNLVDQAFKEGVEHALKCVKPAKKDEEEFQPNDYPDRSYLPAYLRPSIKDNQLSHARKIEERLARNERRIEELFKSRYRIVAGRNIALTETDTDVNREIRIDSYSEGGGRP